MKISIRERRGPGRCLVIGPLVLLSLIPLGCEGRRVERIPGPGHLVDLTAKGHQLQAELAIDSPSREKGLMYRTEMPADQGMLFMWSDRGDRKSIERRRFWMRNTSIPLSIAFIDDDGKILQIEDMRPYDEQGVRSKDEVRFALEMNQGWFDKNGIKPGDAFDDFRKGIGGIEAR